MFCFFENLAAAGLGLGEEERFLFEVVVVVMTVVVAIFWSAGIEELEEEEVEERAVFATEGFCIGVAWRVALESLET